MQKMKKSNTKKTERQALLELADLCSKSEQCCHDMLTKMQRWQLTEEEQARIMQYLTENKFIDETRYTRAFVNDKITYSKWGRRKIEQALWIKHIPKEIQNGVLDGISDSKYLTILRQLIKSKKRSIKANSDYERRAKLIRFALERGYTMDIIRQCVDDSELEYLADEDDC